jgi:hypothetical protein
VPIDPVRRVSNWDAKFKTDRIKAVLDDKRDAMFSRVSAVIPAIASMEGQVKQVVDGLGVATIQIPFYLDFGREMWRLQDKDISGETLAMEAAVLISKWTARGLTEAVLQAIRTQVFNVVAPTP